MWVSKPRRSSSRGASVVLVETFAWIPCGTFLVNISPADVAASSSSTVRWIIRISLYAVMEDRSSLHVLVN